ncbi:MAG TPA: serine hydrolase domain-containing protein [Pyrinomonadaceae bacterium]|jgi:CubicO group peptidase (beta-lactamase class C family)
MNASRQEQLDALFAAWDTAESPGCALGIYSEGELSYARGFGIANLEHAIPIKPSTMFHVASLSKQFTAMAVGLLARGGYLSLDDDIRQYVPDIPAGPGITFRQIIHHTSGLRDQWDLLRLGGWRHADLKTTADILRLAALQTGLNFQPGTRFQYINTGYTLLAIVIERVTGCSLREYADENIFKPLGMQDTFFQDDHRKIIRNRAQAYSRGHDSQLRIDVPAYETVGPTGLFTTIEEFARWERNFISPKVGDEEFIKQMLSPGTLADGKRTSYGFGLIKGQYRGLEIAEHAGGDAGYRAHYLRFPGEHFAVAIFANFSEVKPSQLARKVADICLAGRFTTENPEGGEIAAWAGRAAGHAALSAQELESRCGTYLDSLSGTTCRIEARGGRLFLVPSSGGEYELAQAGDELFRFQTTLAEALFKPPVADEPWRMIITYAGDVTADSTRIVEDEDTDSHEPIAQYAGTYQSGELDCLYVVEPSNEGLVLRHTKFGPCALVPLRRDEFSCPQEGLHLRFVRDTEGRLGGFVLNAERVWNIGFTRL